MTDKLEPYIGSEAHTLAVNAQVAALATSIAALKAKEADNG